jgi:hypothetical protein
MSTCNFIPKTPKGLTFTPKDIKPGTIFLYRVFSDTPWTPYLAIEWEGKRLKTYNFKDNTFGGEFEYDNENYKDSLLILSPSDVTLNFQVD